ncbi:hypothetical protein SSAG_00312 [Streptomyces sp. Mg1]|nr:hypothetical protein SSAG_00312 [Streptomyces sp. Mg1]
MPRGVLVHVGRPAHVVPTVGAGKACLPAEQAASEMRPMGWWRVRCGMA